MPPGPPPPAGEEPHTGIVAGITPGPITLVTTVEDERLEFQDGACCVLRHAWLAPTRARDEVPLWACCLLLQRNSKPAPPPSVRHRPTRCPIPPHQASWSPFPSWWAWAS